MSPISESTQVSYFQQAIDTVEALSFEEQGVLLDLLQRRLCQQRRGQIVEEIAAVCQEVAEGKISFGSAADFLAELDQ